MGNATSWLGTPELRHTRRFVTSKPRCQEFKTNHNCIMLVQSQMQLELPGNVIIVGTLRHLDKKAK